MQWLVDLLAVIGVMMTMLLAYLAVRVIAGGVKRRATGLGVALPAWPETPAGWIPEEGDAHLVQKPTPWPASPDGQSWEALILALRPEGPAERPHSIPLTEAEERTLLFLPGRYRGVNGWWVVLLG